MRGRKINGEYWQGALKKEKSLKKERKNKAILYISCFFFHLPKLNNKLKLLSAWLSQYA